MRPERVLLVVPALVVALLLQSYAWVPTYENQADGNPGRLRTFIEASIGDAKILNPILNADVASSRISDLVFDGLLGLDENLKLRGRIARSWRIYEVAYLLVAPGARLADGSPATAAAITRRLRERIAADASGELGRLITGIKTLAPEQRIVEGGELPAKLRLRVHLPERLRLELSGVAQDLRARLTPVLGAAYARGFAQRASIEVLAGDPKSLDAKLRGALLPTIEHNPVIVFRLRRNVRFHDGYPLTANDVRFTYQAIMDPRNLSARRSDFEPVRAVEVLDDYTVKVTYKRLFSPAINAWTIGILPAHLLNRKALQREMDARGLSAEARANFGLRDSRFNRHPIGSGAFRFREWQSDELIHLVRNPGYWEGAPEYHDYYFRVIPDPLTQEVEFRTGALDAYAPQPYQVDRYRRDPAYRAFSTPGLGYTYIGYNNRRPLFSDPRVRRALGMAIDTGAIIRYVLYGEGEPISGPYPRTTIWYDPGVRPLPYDPAGAQRLLAELGWQRNADGWLEKDGKVFEFNLITNNGNSLRKAVLSIAQHAWRKIGIKVHTEVFEWAVFLEDFINPAQFDALILGWSMGADPDLYQLWHSSQTGRNQLNFVGYRSAEADALIERIRREYDIDAQRRLAHRLHRVIARDQPYTFLYAPRSTRVLDRKIVMRTAGGGYTPVRAAASGDLYYFMNRWIKLAYAPRF